MLMLILCAYLGTGDAVNDCAPCECCKPGSNCSYNDSFRIQNYCSGGCADGYGGPTCEHACASKNCITCSPDGTCDTCKDGFYGKSCRSKCIFRCQACKSSRSCTSCSNGYYEGTLETGCNHKCQPECRSCMNGSSCISCKSNQYFGSTCSTHCPSLCKHKTCSVNGTCVDCRNGFYGIACNDTCSPQCLNGECERITGHCLQCVDGYKLISGKCEASHCDYCREHLCDFDTKHCLRGCADGYRRDTNHSRCTVDTSRHSSHKEVNLPNGKGAIAGAIVGAIFIITFVVILAVVIHTRRRNAKSGSEQRNSENEGSKTEGAPNNIVLGNVMEPHNYEDLCAETGCQPEASYNSIEDKDNGALHYVTLVKGTDQHNYATLRTESGRQPETKYYSLEGHNSIEKTDNVYQSVHI
ncbi:major surface trophozoite antigen 11-like [Mya arenaria]|uniref:major surface trophozoite antigen 11-like n=2 Tax=Mya arenaria TaxID=6604 RepID=UPI0022E3197C|nr:major surface trophozoite antigen 11-like [Mya arenaria]